MAKWIIVVDDDMANLKVAGHILQKQQMRVTCIKSGPKLLEYVDAGNVPDLILLDIKMPGMDGFETLSLLREMEQKKGLDQIPVIFLTAEEGTDTESRGFEVGVSDFIRKPFDADVLLRRINNIVSQHDTVVNLRSEATTDKLTGFLNKAATGEALSKFCSNSEGSLAMIDLDSFKLVNDICGHEMGDKILIAFADILRKNAPESSQYGRIGGDEFNAFLFGLLTAEELTDFTQRLNDQLVAEAKRLMGENMDIPLGVSVGAVQVPKHGVVYDTLLKFADKALYVVKKNGKHGCLYYRAEDYEDDELNRSRLSIDTISEILGERSIPDVALQLDKDAFSDVYRYVMRYNARNSRIAGKLLFTLDEPEGVDRQVYLDACDAFSNHIRDSLRKSDIFMRTRFNQYFVLLTEIRMDSLSLVCDHLIEKWEKGNAGLLVITSEHELVVLDHRGEGQSHDE